MRPVEQDATEVVLVTGWSALADVVPSWLGDRHRVRAVADVARAWTGTPGTDDMIIVGPDQAEPDVIGLLRMVNGRMPVVVIVAKDDPGRQVRWLRWGASAVVHMDDLDGDTIHHVVREVRSGRAVANDAAMQCLQESLRIEGDLTDRQLAVIRLIESGVPIREIADRLYVTESTVKTHVQRLCRRFGVADRKGLAALVRGVGLGSDASGRPILGTAVDGADSGECAERSPGSSMTSIRGPLWRKTFSVSVRSNAWIHLDVFGALASIGGVSVSDDPSAVDAHPQ